MCHIEWDPNTAQVYHKRYIYMQKKKTLKGRFQKKKNTLFVFDHEIHQNVATDVIGCRSTRNDKKFSGIDMESPKGA